MTKLLLIISIILITIVSCKKADDNGNCYVFERTTQQYIPGGGGSSTILDDWSQCGLSESEAAHICRDNYVNETYPGGGFLLITVTYKLKR
jgi:hypothetical protein